MALLSFTDSRVPAISSPVMTSTMTAAGTSAIAVADSSSGGKPMPICTSRLLK